MMKTRIGELLRKHDIITEKQLQEALELQKTGKRKLGEILLEKGYVNTEHLFWMLSEQADVPYVDVRLEMIDQDLINLFPWKVLRENHILPLYETDKEIFVAVGDPTNNIIIEKMSKFSDKKINISCANPHTIDKLLDHIYQAQESEMSTDAQPARNMKIVIKAEHASIEMTDETGKTTKRNARVKIIVDTEQKKKEDT
jgi:hypothetical protein